MPTTGRRSGPSKTFANPLRDAPGTGAGADGRRTSVSVYARTRPTVGNEHSSRQYVLARATRRLGCLALRHPSVIPPSSLDHPSTRRPALPWIWGDRGRLHKAFGDII